jgi:hypothetical protein
VLTKGDDYPLHQTPEPVAYVGANRNFYDRFFFNGYNKSGEVFFAAAMGIYPYLNIMDGAFSIIVDGVQHNVYGSKVMHMERLDTNVGAIGIDITKPMEELRLTCNDAANGIKADLVFTARMPAHEEPRFTRRTGSQVTMDVTRMMQNGTWSGWIELKGKRIEVTPEEYCGTRDRSWGIRGVGAADLQPNPVSSEFQFYWLWAPLNFDKFSAHYFVNDDAKGNAWNTNGVIIPDFGQGDAETMRMVKSDLTFASGTRFAASAEIFFEKLSGEQMSFKLTPKWNFYMKGIGYGHEKFKHGSYHGELETGYDEFVLAEVPPVNVHIQAMCDVVFYSDAGEIKGQGVLEQLVMGPHAPSGFKETMDFAP